ncbi:DUF6538 domain-containing protein [Nitrosospira sp. Nsp1]|uniref:DUF6538 domain-containing protein n=1 Tax=Nitrosospira sp. Nsp1 TaxID=136547 RepID=UPI00352437E4
MSARRGDTFSFRIAIPAALHGVIGKREFIKALHTTDKHCGSKGAKACGCSKAIFSELTNSN